MNNPDKYKKLISYGWNGSFEGEFEPYAREGYVPARIVRGGRGIFGAVGAAGDLRLEPSGSFRHVTDIGLQDIPVVGDWCAVSGTADNDAAPSGPAVPRARIEGVLPRRTVLYRAAADSTKEAPGTSEAAVANIDTVAAVMDIARDFNLRRVERFLANIESGGAEAALILTKIDLVDDPETFRCRTETRFSGLRIFLIDSISGRGRDDLAPLFEPGSTTALVGMSGAGKSTLLNMIMGRPTAKTAVVREQDGRGRHTTTERTLYLLPGGGLLIDTPGIRAVGISAGRDAVENSFEDIHALAEECRFSDCTHRHEPGCAVQKALADGLIEQDRYLNFLRILSEAVTAEEEQRRRKEKDDYIGRIQYQMRRERQRNDRRGR